MNVRRVQFEILQINQLLETYQDLLDRVVHKSPDLVEVTALASVLHSFYTGVESIFTRHSYSYQLDWDEMSELVYELRETWRLLQDDLLSFLSSYLNDQQSSV